MYCSFLYKNVLYLVAVEDVNALASSVATNLQQLSIEDDRGFPSDGDGPSVLIPDHLQVQTADCSHLSFGSFGGVSFSGSHASAPAKTSLEDAPKDADSSSVGHLGTRFVNLLNRSHLCFY